MNFKAPGVKKVVMDPNPTAGSLPYLGCLISSDMRVHCLIA